MAEIFWQHGDQSVANALIASCMLKNLSEDRSLRGPQMAEEREKMRHNAEKFERLAVQVLAQCYNADIDKTRKMLEKPIEEFNGATSIHMAFITNSLEFLSHPAAQDKINKVSGRGSGKVWVTGRSSSVLSCAISLMNDVVVH